MWRERRRALLSEQAVQSRGPRVRCDRILPDVWRRRTTVLWFVVQPGFARMRRIDAHLSTVWCEWSAVLPDVDAVFDGHVDLRPDVQQLRPVWTHGPAVLFGIDRQRVHFGSGL